jgi:type VI secretion system protein ImpJ
MSAHDVATFWFRHAINSALAPLRHLYTTKRGHPEELFQEMSRLAGALCTFGLDSHPRTLPAYDHCQLQVCFEELDRHIREHLEIILPSRAIAIPLVRTAPNFYEGNVTDARALGTARWLLGIHSPIGDADLIQKTPVAVKICSAKFVPELVKRALPGMPVTHVPVPPSAIAPKVEYQYFSISRVGACWEHIMQTRRVGIYVPGDLPEAELELVVVPES